MLERAGETDTRPDGLEDGFGLIDGKYRLSPSRRRRFWICGCID